MPRRMYFPATVSSTSTSGTSERPLSPPPVPARELPQIVVPARDMRGQLAAERRGPARGEDGLDVIVRHHEVVELDEQRRALHRVELLLDLLVDLVIFLALPARDIAPLPLVFLVRHLPRHILVHEELRIGLRHGRVV